MAIVTTLSVVIWFFTGTLGIFATLVFVTHFVLYTLCFVICFATHVVTHFVLYTFDFDFQLLIFDF